MAKQTMMPLNITGGRRFSRRRLVSLIEKILVDSGGVLSIEKLCLMLYRCDMSAYQQQGKSLTGCEYYKTHWGFYPNGLAKALRTMGLYHKRVKFKEFQPRAKPRKGKLRV